MKSLLLRLAKEEDAAELLEIYRPYVESPDFAVSDTSFEYEVPTLEEWRERMAAISGSFPYILLEEKKKILGYAYAHSYRERAAYHGCVEVTIYIRREATGRGRGRLLYAALEELLRMMNIVNAYACITAHNEASLAFHRALGYKLCGSFPKSGFKNGHYIDMVWLAKQLAPYPPMLEPLKKISELEGERVEAILAAAVNKR